MALMPSRQAAILSRARADAQPCPMTACVQCLRDHEHILAFFLQAVPLRGAHMAFPHRFRQSAVFQRLLCPGLWACYSRCLVVGRAAGSGENAAGLGVQAGGTQAWSSMHFSQKGSFSIRHFYIFCLLIELEAKMAPSLAQTCKAVCQPSLASGRSIHGHQACGLDQQQLCHRHLRGGHQQDHRLPRRQPNHPKRSEAPQQVSELRGLRARRAALSAPEHQPPPGPSFIDGFSQIFP